VPASPEKIKNHEAFIWQVADLLRSNYRPAQYQAIAWFGQRARYRPDSLRAAGTNSADLWQPRLGLGPNSPGNEGTLKLGACRVQDLYRICAVVQRDCRVKFAHAD
jgi:hypothetical protein